MKMLAARLFAAALLACLVGTVQAQERPVLKAGSISGPLVNPIVWNIMKAKGFDAKNGFDLQITLYPSITAFYGGFTTGEVEAIMGGPSNLAKLNQEGVGLQILATTLPLSDFGIFTKDPAIHTLKDLAGKQLAADMGGSQYQILMMYARGKDIDMSKATIINANFMLARAQLVAGRVDAALVVEPTTTQMLREDPSIHAIFTGNDGWQELTGHGGWENVATMRNEAIQRHPDMPEKLIAALRDSADFAVHQVDEADKIVVETVKLPPGVFKEAVLGNRLYLDVRPAWQDQRAVIWDQFQRAVAAGFSQKMPDPSIIYTPRN
jgi:NitT/TauT family transport system substrate-binding protein